MTPRSFVPGQLVTLDGSTSSLLSSYRSSPRGKVYVHAYDDPKLSSLRYHGLEAGAVLVIATASRHMPPTVDNLSVLVMSGDTMGWVDSCQLS